MSEQTTGRYEQGVCDALDFVLEGLDLMLVIDAEYVSKYPGTKGVASFLGAFKKLIENRRDQFREGR